MMAEWMKKTGGELASKRKKTYEFIGADGESVELEGIEEPPEEISERSKRSGFKEKLKEKISPKTYSLDGEEPSKDGLKEKAKNLVKKALPNNTNTHNNSHNNTNTVQYETNEVEPGHGGKNKSNEEENVGLEPEQKAGAIDIAKRKQRNKYANSKQDENEEDVELDSGKERKVKLDKIDPEEERRNQLAKTIRMGKEGIELEEDKVQRGDSIEIEDDEDDPSVAPWNYTIVIDPEILESRYAIKSKALRIADSIVIPIQALLDRTIYEDFIGSGNWEVEIIDYAKTQNGILIDNIVQLIKKTDKEILLCNEEAEETEAAIAKLDDAIAELTNDFVGFIQHGIAGKINGMIEEYAKIKEGVKHERKKCAVKIGMKGGHIVLVGALAAATHAVFGPQAFIAIGLDAQAIGNEIKTLVQNPGTIAIEIDKGFAILNACPLSKRGQSMVEFFKNAAVGVTGISFPLTYDNMKLAIQKHKFATESLITARHKIGVILTKRGGVDADYEGSRKLNKIARSFPKLIKDMDKLQELNNSYKERIDYHVPLNAAYVEELEAISSNYSHYARSHKTVSLFQALTKLGLAMDPSALADMLTDLGADALEVGAEKKLAK
jgi:hypothetical protein